MRKWEIEIIGSSVNEIIRKRDTEKRVNEKMG
jgi:hypothetical protein